MEKFVFNKGFRELQQVENYRAKEIQNLQKNRAICAWLNNRV